VPGGDDFTMSHLRVGRRRMLGNFSADRNIGLICLEIILSLFFEVESLLMEETSQHRSQHVGVGFRSRSHLAHQAEKMSGLVMRFRV
jgi:hypothetical protein